MALSLPWLRGLLIARSKLVRRQWLQRGDTIAASHAATSCEPSTRTEYVLQYLYNTAPQATR